MRFWRFLAAFALATSLLWTSYGALFFFQVGARTAAEYWLYDAMTVKHHLLISSAPQRKILFVGGSSVWFGIDAGLVEQTLGAPALNLGLHAMLPLDQLTTEIRPTLKSGDMVIMPLEYEYYLIDTPFNGWYVNQVMAGEPEVFWALSWQQKLSFFLAVPPMRVLEGAVTRMFPDRGNKVRARLARQPPEKVIASMQQVWAQQSLPVENYTFQNINAHGDAILTRGSFTSYVYPLSTDSVATTYPWETLAKFARYCTDRSIALYITWPPVVEGTIAFESRPLQDKVRHIERNLDEIGLTVLGHAEDFQYNRRLFTDSGYHLNHEGRALHTKRTLRFITGDMDPHDV